MNQHDNRGLCIDDALALREDDADQEPRLVLPSGILDAEMWRGRILTVLTAAGAAGMTSAEIEEALTETWASSVDYKRVRRWLAEAAATGTAVCDGDGFFYVAGFAVDGGLQDAGQSRGDRS